MGLMDRFTRNKNRGGATTTRNADAQYLANWTRAHIGVEAFIEPKTTVTDVTVVLVANDGEWTRRIVGEHGARKIGKDLGIPVYDVRKTGYPQRMRDHDARQRILRKRKEVEGL